MAYAPHLKDPIFIDGVKVSNEPVKYLGVWVGEEAACSDRMFTDLLTKMRNIISQ